MSYLINELEQVSFAGVLAKRCHLQPDDIAYIYLIDGEQQQVQITYRELACQAQAIAAHLQSLNAFGCRALLLFPSGLEFIASFLGCLYAGVTAVPLMPNRSRQNLKRMQAIASDAQATFALTTSQLQADLTSVLMADRQDMHWLAVDQISAHDAEGYQPPLIHSEDLAFLQYTSGTTGVPKGVMISHQNLLHNASMIQDAFESSKDSIGVSWLPMYHDMGLIGGALQPLYVGRPTVLMSPTAFIQKPKRWLAAISRFGATNSGGPNFAYDLCLKKIQPEQLSDLDLSTWEVAFTGAESIQPGTLEAFSKRFQPYGFSPRAFHPCYGLAENTLIVSSKQRGEKPYIQRLDGVALEQHRVNLTDVSTPSTRAIVSCGQTILDQNIVIVSPDTLKLCHDRQVGEIWLSGASVAQGYWRRPELTREIFEAQLLDVQLQGPSHTKNFLRTGDLGFIQNGEVFITGRLKDLVIIRGRNHYPQDIESSVQSSHPSLRAGHSVAFSLSIDGVEQLVICQEVERTYVRKLDADSIFEAIRGAVSHEHHLKVYAITLLKPGSLPKTSSGKIQRSACKAAFSAGEFKALSKWQETQANVAQIEKSTQALLAKLQSQQSVKSEDFRVGVKTLAQSSIDIQCWILSGLALKLELEPQLIALDQPFSNYGLDSASAIEMAAELSDWLGQEIEPTIFWEYPTIETLAHYLGRDQS